MSIGEIIALLSLLALGAGGALTYAYNQGRVAGDIKALQDLIATLKVDVTKSIDDLKAEHLRSATSQGDRIGALAVTTKDAIGTLFDFKNRLEGREEERRHIDTRGVPLP